MKKYLLQLFDHLPLTRTQAREVMEIMAAGHANEAEMAACMAVFRMRSITPEELAGFRDALLALCVPVDLAVFDPVDVCGTGGDGKDTFNISTLAAFVVAGAGGRVAKHGNYGVSSVSGSSHVMEQLGYRFSADAGKLQREIEATGLCFMHAPLFHPALKQVGNVRKQLGISTFFNMLGPMVNPALPRRQVVGVFSLELARRYAYLWQQEPERRFAVVHSLDGYDELSLTGPVKIIRHTGEQVLTPEAMGFEPVVPEALYGGASPAEAAAIFLEVLSGKGNPARQAVVVANAALALQCTGLAPAWPDAVALARASLQEGKALAVFRTLMDLQ